MEEIVSCKTREIYARELNIDYCQNLLDYLSKVDPCKIKYFDEAGLRLLDCGRPNYGHSPVNTPYIEIGRYLTSANVSLNLLMGFQGGSLCKHNRWNKRYPIIFEFLGRSLSNSYGEWTVDFTLW